MLVEKNNGETSQSTPKKENDTQDKMYPLIKADALTNITGL